MGEFCLVSLVVVLEFVNDKTKKQRFDAGKKVGPKVSEACLEQKLTIPAMPDGDSLGYAPPLSIT